MCRGCIPDSHPARHFNSNPYQSGGGSNCMEITDYQSPAVQALELYSEGVLCSSSGTELLEENEGIW